MKKIIGSWILIVGVLIVLYVISSFKYAKTFSSEKQVFDNVASVNTNSWGAEYNLGILGTNKDERIEHMKKAHEIAPSGAQIEYDFYKSMIEAGEYTAALLVLDKLVEKDKSYLQDRAALNIFLENYDDACRDSHDYVEFKNGDPNALFLYGCCLESALKWNEAWLVFKTLGEMSLDLNMVNHALCLNKDFRNSYVDPYQNINHVLIVGDSIANGADSTNLVTKTLAQRLDHLAKTTVTNKMIFSDFSRDGLRASQILTNNSLVDDIVTNVADKVVIVAGVNDAWDGVCARTIAKHISIIALTCIENRTRPIIVGPIPVMSVYDRDRRKQEKILSELNVILGDFCATNNLSFVDIRKELNSRDSDVKKWIHPNFGNHLNDEGMDVLRDVVMKVILTAKSR